MSTAKFPGYVGTVLVPPAPEAGIDAWMSILIFRTDGQLAAWSTSDERGAPPVWLFAAVDWLDFWRH